MKRTLLTLCFASLLATALAQPRITFDEKEHDFGTFEEETGRVTHVFRFVNSGNEPLVVTNVRTTCGCTASQYTREPIAPNDSGEIKVTYNPKGRPGRFSKPVYVTTNASVDRENLRITGVVIGSKSRQHANPYHIGDLSLRSLHIPLFDTPKGHMRTGQLAVRNEGKNELIPIFKHVPSHMQVEMIPSILHPNEEGIIKIHYDPDAIDGSVQFAHVNFGYLPDKTIIHDFSATIQPGTKVAIVGPTGAGKTTIVKLLMRFYDVNQGAVLLSGYDVRQFARGEMRDSFGMVLQDTWLYNDTILENIRFGRLSATDEEVLQAAKAAQVDHFVRTLPHGYDTVLNEDASNISQGQKQLLTIARTILSDPKILILDEATSSVDTRTEVAIQRAMDHLTQGRTSFIIAHRLSTIRNADVILVMRDGDIVETGTHQQLLDQNGFYATLYNSQFATTATTA